MYIEACRALTRVRKSVTRSERLQNCISNNRLNRAGIICNERNSMLPDPRVRKLIAERNESGNKSRRPRKDPSKSQRDPGMTSNKRSHYIF